MTEPQLPPKEANLFLRQVGGAGASPSGSTARAPSSPKGDGKPLQKITGILGEVMNDGRRKIYTSSSLDEGVEILDAAIRNYRLLPPNKVDGLEYDVVWVDFDADIISFSRRRRSDRDPDGGTGFPPSTKTGGGGFPGI